MNNLKFNSFYYLFVYMTLEKDIIHEEITIPDVNSERFSWDGLPEHVTEVVQIQVSDILLFEYPNHSDIVAELLSTKKSILSKVLFFTKTEWELVNKELLEMSNLFKDEHWTITSSNFIRCYEWFAILKQIQAIVENKDYKIDYASVAKFFREWLQQEPNRSNILWLLLACIIGSKVVDEK